MKRLICLILLITTVSFVSAKCKRRCEVSYSTNNGWSKKYNVEVTFLTGWELNTATKNYKYSMTDVYAIIFWGDDKATIIKLSSILVCGNEVNCSCISNSTTDLKGRDQDGDEWKICTSDIICI